MELFYASRLVRNAEVHPTSNEIAARAISYGGIPMGNPESLGA